MRQRSKSRFLRTVIASALVAVLIGATGSVLVQAGGRTAFCDSNRSPESFDARHLGERRLSARLVVAPGSTRAGAFAPIRLLNEGTDELSLATERIQRWVRGSWVTVPEVVPHTLSSILVAGESVSPCIGPRTYSRWPRGSYRWVLTVLAMDNTPPRTGSDGEHILRAIFRVRH